MEMILLISISNMGRPSRETITSSLASYWAAILAVVTRAKERKSDMEGLSGSVIGPQKETRMAGQQEKERDRKREKEGVEGERILRVGGGC